MDFSNVDDCKEVCDNINVGGEECVAFHYYPPYNSSWTNQCWFKMGTVGEYNCTSWRGSSNNDLRYYEKDLELKNLRRIDDETKLTAFLHTDELSAGLAL